MDTLRLNTATWDLTVDAYGNIATVGGGYAIAQDVASEVRLFLGELWYDMARGVPYFEVILGKMPSPQFMKTKFIEAGSLTPEVAEITCYLSGVGKNRLLEGQLQIIDVNGQLSVVSMTGEKPWYITAVSPSVQPL